MKDDTIIFLTVFGILALALVCVTLISIFGHV